MKKDIFFIGEVNGENVNQLIRDVQDTRLVADEIRLFVCSPGGNGWLGVCFYDWAKSEKITLTTIATGYVASAATYVFLSGTTRKATANSTFLIHHGGFPTDKFRNGLIKLIAPSKHKEDRDTDAFFVKTRAAIIHQETNIALTDALAYLTKTHLVFGAVRAKELGFIQEIV